MSRKTTTPARPTLRQRKGTHGQTLVEYALILALISVLAILMLLTMSGQIFGIFTMITNRISDALATFH